MKKVHILLLLMLLNAGLFSCTKPDVADDGANIQACCGDEGEIPPPPPPPPGDN